MKTFIIAGASSAIAIETAKQLQQKSFKVIGISTKDKTFNYDEFYKIDSYAFNKFPAIEEEIHGLVYFPGTINLKPFARFNNEDFTKDFEINTLGAVACLQTYLNGLKKSNKASVVLISSVAVSAGMPFHASIAMAKGAIEGLTKSLAAEFAPTIRVNCIAPSLVNTPLGEKFINTPEKMEVMQKKNPMKKVGTPTEVANAVFFLLNDESSWITGQTLNVDGGMNHLKNS